MTWVSNDLESDVRDTFFRVDIQEDQKTKKIYVKLNLFGHMVAKAWLRSPEPESIRAMYIEIGDQLDRLLARKGGDKLHDV